MALARVTFGLEGDAQYQRGFRMMESEARDLTTPLTGVSRTIRSVVGDQFGSEGSRSKRWKPLNAQYADWKADNAPIGEAAPMLVFTGALREAALSWGAFTIGPRRLVYEIDDDKAIHHQQGHENLPQRKILNLTGKDRRALDREFVQWLNSLRRGIIGGGR